MRADQGQAGPQRVEDACANGHDARSVVRDDRFTDHVADKWVIQSGMCFLDQERL